MNRMIATHMPAAFAPAAACPPPEVWAACAVGDVAPERSAELDAHAERCQQCAAERRLAQVCLDDAAVTRDADVEWIVERLQRPASITPIAARNRRVWQTVFAVAAAAMLIIAVVPGIDWMRSGTLPAVPGNGVTRGAGIDIVGPRGELSTAPQRLQWLPVGDAVIYRVAVVGVDGEVLWTADTTGRSVELPSALVERMQPAVVYNWWVEALDEQHRRLARSLQISFRVSP